jgi:hypothetical protein
MKFLTKCLLMCVPMVGLIACGCGDAEDRLDVADPTVGFVHELPSSSTENSIYEIRTTNILPATKPSCAS